MKRNDCPETCQTLILLNTKDASILLCHDHATHYEALGGFAAASSSGVPSMYRVMPLIHHQAPWCEAYIGGAYAMETGWDRIHDTLCVTSDE